ncbi:AraC family transcriptional regulator [Methylocapsa sp. S129]|uniref:AraC family transcriptional regulator n=1 Tax=Methylocapsa sp. S129 TaxID=1641869 RepID=UPI00131E453F|nr:AraC family transcriptional regulator [Methylocapsa sp. S129]
MDILRLASADLPSAQRLEVFRELFGRDILKIQLDPEPDAPFEADMTLQSLPGLGIGAVSFTPLRASLTGELIDNDDFVFVIMRAGTGTARQYGREETIRGGEAIVTANEAPATFTQHSRTQTINLRFERKRLAPLLADAGASALRPMAKDNPALRLLTSYIGAIGEDLPRSAPDLQRVAVDHIHDLAVLALGATRDAAEIAKGRGVRVARLHAIKADVTANLTAKWLSVDALAARHRISTRYIRALFQGEETTFADFVANQRLTRAHRLLVDSRRGVRSISTIAFDAGFDDLSYFNRRFRRRYGATPSDVRMAARRENRAEDNIAISSP